MSFEDSDHALIKHFSNPEDPRDSTQVRHDLLDMIAHAIAAVIRGADDGVSIAAFARAKEEWLRKVLDLSNGIPSPDTFGRVFLLLAPQVFEECFRAWGNAVRRAVPEEVVAIDGKSVRRSQNRGTGLGPLHMVSAWATEKRVVLGQVATAAKSNEITAIPRLLELLALKGGIVTIDAMGCQTKIAAQIIEAGGDYVLALKGNQGPLADEVEEAFIDADARDYAGLDSQTTETREHAHGRVETPRYRTLGHLDGVPRRALWKGLNMIGMVDSQREVDGKTATEYRFYIGRIGIDAARFAPAVRGHWGIENDLHWSLDVAFREDESRLRDPRARENFAVLRYIALTRLKNDKREKMGIKNKRLKAGGDDNDLSHLLFETG